MDQTLGNKLHPCADMKRNPTLLNVKPETNFFGLTYSMQSIISKLIPGEICGGHCQVYQFSFHQQIDAKSSQSTTLITSL